MVGLVGCSPLLRCLKEGGTCLRRQAAVCVHMCVCVCVCELWVDLD